MIFDLFLAEPDHSLETKGFSDLSYGEQSFFGFSFKTKGKAYLKPTGRRSQPQVRFKPTAGFPDLTYGFPKLFALQKF